jgi:ribosomal protein S18 acetylase RimI-like enzyme
MEYRLATPDDLAQLGEMRWQARSEGGERPAESRERFLAAYTDFFQQGLRSKSHILWVACDGATIIALVSIAIAPLAPRPCRPHDSFGYISDNYTRPQYRNRGIGAELMRHAAAWAKEEDLELLIVWPSERAIPFYGRLGFRSDNDVMQLELREYYAPDGETQGNPTSAST